MPRCQQSSGPRGEGSASQPQDPASSWAFLSAACVARTPGGKVPTPVCVTWVSGGDMVKAEEEESGRA